MQTYWCDDINKKKSKFSEEIYRPISILPNVSRICERCLYDQITTYFEHIFSRYQCSFRKGYSAQHCLLAMIEKWEKIVVDGGIFGALLTDLSKAFNGIPHDLIIAKLEGYGFHVEALRLIHDYFSNRKQRVKVNDAYTSWKNVLYILWCPTGIHTVIYYSIHIYVNYFIFWKT